MEHIYEKKSMKSKVIVWSDTDSFVLECIDFETGFWNELNIYGLLFELLLYTLYAHFKRILYIVHYIVISWKFYNFGSIDSSH